MDFWNPDKRPQKELAREFVVSDLQWLSHSLWLPGEGSQCILKAIQKGIVDFRSRLVLVERDQHRWHSIEDKLMNLPWIHSPFCWRKDLENLILPFPLSFAFLDFNGGFKKTTIEWLQRNLLMREGGSLAITHSYAWRSNSFLYRFLKNKNNLEDFRRLRIQTGIMNDQILTPLLLMKKFVAPCYHFETKPLVRYRDSCRTMVLYRFVNFRERKVS